MPVDPREQFGKRLEKVLTEHDLTRRAVAVGAKCTGATIGRWLRGEVPYSILILAELHKQYGIDLNTLICGETRKDQTHD